MRGYVNIPGNIYVKCCKECGARPVIAIAKDALYVVKCQANNDHYQTPPGIIDIEDWNLNNAVPRTIEYKFDTALAVHL